MHNQTFYKIQHLETALYSKGGTDCIHEKSMYWSKEGKVWNNASSLRRHLALYFLTEYRHYTEEQLKILQKWKVIEFKIRDSQLTINEFTTLDFYNKNI